MLQLDDIATSTIVRRSWTLFYLNNKNPINNWKIVSQKLQFKMLGAIAVSTPVWLSAPAPSRTCNSIPRICFLRRIPCPTMSLCQTQNFSLFSSTYPLHFSPYRDSITQTQFSPNASSSSSGKFHSLLQLHKLFHFVICSFQWGSSYFVFLKFSCYVQEIADYALYCLFSSSISKWVLHSFLFSFDEWFYPICMWNN